MKTQTLSETLDKHARERITQTLKENDNDMMRAATALGIHLATLYAKCKKLGIKTAKKS